MAELVISVTLLNAIELRFFTASTFARANTMDTVVKFFRRITVMMLHMRSKRVVQFIKSFIAPGTLKHSILRRPFDLGGLYAIGW
jgi:hypothetical protein